MLDVCLQGEIMKYRVLLIGFIVLVLSACNIKGNNYLKPEEPVLSNAKAYSLEKLKFSNSHVATVYDYVFYAAKNADAKGFSKFALVEEYKKDKLGILTSNGIKAFMFNDDADLKVITNFESKFKLLGIFETKEYKDKRYVPIGYLPGAV
jgi:hypothetical protein